MGDALKCNIYLSLGYNAIVQIFLPSEEKSSN